MCRIRAITLLLWVEKEKLISKYVQSLLLIYYSPGSSKHYFPQKRNPSDKKQLPAKYRNAPTAPPSQLIAPLVLTCSMGNMLSQRTLFTLTRRIIFKCFKSALSPSEGGNRLAAIYQSANVYGSLFLAAKYTIWSIWRIGPRPGPEADCLNNCCCAKSEEYAPVADGTLQYNLY